MNSAVQSQSQESLPGVPLSVASEGIGVDAELARYMPHINHMSDQLKQASSQIESAVVGVCSSFQGIAQRAKETVERTAGFLNQEGDARSGKPSFEGLIQNCSGTLVKILNTTEEAGEVSRSAIDRIQQMDKASQMIGSALLKLEQIARENKMLAMNARIEAAHAGIHGAGFAVVAVEVVSQTERSQQVTAQVSGLIANLRALAGSTLEDLRRLNEKDHRRLEECRLEVDESLRELQTTHGEMKKMLTGMTDEGALLATDIGAAVRGLQFQDRTGQQIAHVVEDLDTLHAKLAGRFGSAVAGEAASREGFSGYSMFEERKVAGIEGAESAAGDIELF